MKLRLLGMAGLLALALSISAAEAQRGPAAPLPPIPLKDPIYRPGPNQDINGVWWIDSYSAKIKPIEGAELPFTQAGLAAYNKNIAALKNKTLVDDARHICVPDGVPRILASPYPFEIFLTPGQSTFVYELNHVFRPIYMDSQLPTADMLEALPYYSGHSIGHWDGDTLVIESAGFKDTTFIDDTGVPHSDKMTTLERVRRIAGGKQLEIVVTVTDPVIFAKPWSARFVYDSHPEIRIQDYVCGEKHRDLRGVKGAPR